MKIHYGIGLLGAATAAALGTVALTGGTALASNPADKNVTVVQKRVDARAQHIDLKMQTLQVKVAANKHLSQAAKAKLQGEIAKVRQDTAAWRKQVDAARTHAGLQAAVPTHRLVVRDVAVLKADLKPAAKRP